jgi:flagellar hook assembly protein FlgD
LSGPAVDVAIFDVRGRLVRELTGSKGDRTLLWDGRNGFGESVRPGVYFIRLGNGGEVRPFKVTRIR